MKTLQVYLGGRWEYVFCRNERFEFPITTRTKNMAIKGDEHSLEYFKSNFGNLQFRVSSIPL